MSARFTVGERLEGAFETETMKYTLIGDQPNPWPGIESDFAVGTRFTGIVQNTRDGLGAFVKVADPVKGLLPDTSGPEVAHLEQGDHVEVIVTHVNVTQRKIKRRLARRVEAVNPGPPEGG